MNDMSLEDGKLHVLESKDSDNEPKENNKVELKGFFFPSPGFICEDRDI